MRGCAGADDMGAFLRGSVLSLTSAGLCENVSREKKIIWSRPKLGDGASLNIDKSVHQPSAHTSSAIPRKKKLGGITNVMSIINPDRYSPSSRMQYTQKKVTKATLKEEANASISKKPVSHQESPGPGHTLPAAQEARHNPCTWTNAQHAPTNTKYHRPCKQS